MSTHDIDFTAETPRCRKCGKTWPADTLAATVAGEECRPRPRPRPAEGAPLGELLRLQAEVAHWKANHATEVRRARVLKERTDMPLERVQAYERWGRDLAELEALRAAVPATPAEMLAHFRSVLQAGSQAIAETMGADLAEYRRKVIDECADALEAWTPPSDVGAEYDAARYLRSLKK